MITRIQPGLSLLLAGTATATQPCGPSSAPTSGWARQVPGNGFDRRHHPFAALNRKWVHLGYLFVDLILIGLSCSLAFFVRFVELPLREVLRTHRLGLGPDFPLKPYAGFLLVYAILIVLLCQNQELYRTLRGRTAAQESWAVFKSVFIATCLLSAFIFCSNVKVVSREVIAIAFLVTVGALISWRAWKRGFVTRRVEQGIGARNALIIGAGKVGRALAEYLDTNKQLGYRFVGFLDIGLSSDEWVLGDIHDLPRVARIRFVDDIFVTIPSERELVKGIASEARRQHLNVMVVPDMYDGLLSPAPIQHFGEFPVMELHWEAIPTVGLFIKRIIDLFVSAFALISLLPFLAIVAIAVKVTSVGPAIYTSKRIGRKGRVFDCYKFRTMVSNAEELRPSLEHLNERSNGLLFKIGTDPRITALGRLLRAYSIDELPQLWNVLKGEMSLVGPRPPLPTEVNQYALEHLRRLDMKPGLTGFWQITSREDPSFESYMALDLEYIQNWSFWMDAKILFKTIPVVVRGKGQ
jgi:exopolysaccharide biosynthesis polyprenyl glycosylphosphotransferase